MINCVNNSNVSLEHHLTPKKKLAQLDYKMTILIHFLSLETKIYQSLEQKRILIFQFNVFFLLMLLVGCSCDMT